jgi:hypothetical protein
MINLIHLEYDKRQFLDYVKPQADKMHSDIKDTRIIKLCYILNVSKSRKFLLYSLFEYFLIFKEYLS